MIEIHNLYFGYKKKEGTLSGISLCLPPGHIYGILGCNGVGKTTLMKIMSGLLVPAQGEVKTGDFIPAQRKPSFFSRMFLVPEEFDLPNITFGTFIKSTSVFYPLFDRELFEHYASKFNVAYDARMGDMSMGERKKTYIAFALACQPQYLLMDEPTNGLDIPSKSVFKSLLSSYVSPDCTVVISTHQVADIQGLIDGVVIMDKQGIVLNRTTEQLGRALKFGAVRDGDTVLWSKDSLSGAVGVCVNPGGTETEPDLEMLFNAAAGDRERIINILK